MQISKAQSRIPTSGTYRLQKRKVRAAVTWPARPNPLILSYYSASA